MPVYDAACGAGTPREAARTVHSTRSRTGLGADGEPANARVAPATRPSDDSGASTSRCRTIRWFTCRSFSSCRREDSRRNLSEMPAQSSHDGTWRSAPPFGPRARGGSSRCLGPPNSTSSGSTASRTRRAGSRGFAPASPRPSTSLTARVPGGRRRCPGRSPARLPRGPPHRRGPLVAEGRAARPRSPVPVARRGRHFPAAAGGRCVPGLPLGAGRRSRVRSSLRPERLKELLVFGLENGDFDDVLAERGLSLFSQERVDEAVEEFRAEVARLSRLNGDEGSGA